jgi:transposase-like protein
MSFDMKEDCNAEEENTPEEIVAKLRQVDVLVSQGQNIADAIRQIGVSEVTYYRWRQAPEGARAGEYPSAQGDLGPDADKLILQEAARGNF